MAAADAAWILLRLQNNIRAMRQGLTPPRADEITLAMDVRPAR